jgi:hypothetical protein
MLKSSFNLRYPLVDHCCGVCTLVKAVGESEWCVAENLCTGDCQCGNYTDDCEFPEEMTGVNEGLTDLSVTLLCTKCEEQFSSFLECGAVCGGECDIEIVGTPPNCNWCVHTRTCAWGGTDDPPANTICECNVDCFSPANCDFLGATAVVACVEMTGDPLPPPICPSCGGGGPGGGA